MAHLKTLKIIYSILTVICRRFALSMQNVEGIPIRIHFIYYIAKYPYSCP